MISADHQPGRFVKALLRPRRQMRPALRAHAVHTTLAQLLDALAVVHVAAGQRCRLSPCRRGRSLTQNRRPYHRSAARAPCAAGSRAPASGHWAGPSRALAAAGWCACCWGSLAAGALLLQSLPAQILVLRCDGAQLAELPALPLVLSSPVRALALLAAVADLPAGRALHQLDGRNGLFAAVRAPKRSRVGALLYMCVSMKDVAASGSAGDERRVVVSFPWSHTSITAF